VAKAKDIQATLRALGNPDIAEHSLRFFKTAPGEYGANDVFLGIRMPVLRAHINQYQDTSNTEIVKLLRSKFHEERMFALLLWVKKFSKANEAEQEKIVDLYLANTKYINNWDLVDCSSYQIIGGYYLDKHRQPLRQLAKSDLLWERRIAIIATYKFIKADQYKDTFAIATILMKDKEDLIHKAVGWMLREVGNRDRQAQTDYMASRYKKMPRTMLRYAIEKYPAGQRKAYLAGKAG